MKNQWGFILSLIFFSCYGYSRSVACYAYLTSNQKVLIHTTHIKEVIAKLYSFTLRSKIGEKQEKVRKFACHRTRSHLSIPAVAGVCGHFCQYAWISVGSMMEPESEQESDSQFWKIFGPESGFKNFGTWDESEFAKLTPATSADRKSVV